MPAQRILIVYGSTHGQTSKIAHRIGDLLVAVGREVTLLDAAELPRTFEPRGFDGIIVGSSITYRRHQPAVLRFVRAHRHLLSAKPSAFFSVSGAAAGSTETERDKARRCVNRFLRETGWRPAFTATFGGAMAYTRYNPLLRWITSRMSAKAGGPTDTSRDHEFTDWTQVRDFAGDFATLLPHLDRPRAAPPSRVTQPQLGAERELALN